VSTGTPEAARNDSRSRLAERAAPGLVAGVRAALAIAGFAAILMLVLATFATVIEITVAGNANITADIDRTASGWDRHGPALLLLAGFALVMLVGALRGGPPAMFALAACGLAVLLIAFVGDAPDLDKTGAIGELYEGAQAQAGSGFYFESLGGALLLITGFGLLVVGARPATRARPTEGGRGAPGGEAPEPAPGGGAGVAARRLGAGAARGFARARGAMADRAAARRRRAAADRERADAANARARERAASSPAAPLQPDEPAEPAPPAAIEQPIERQQQPSGPEGDASAQDASKLSFDERLREARERARRKP